VILKMSSKRASVNSVLEPPVQLKGWLLSRGTAKSCRGRGRKELTEEARGKGKGRGCEEACGAPMHAAQEQASSSDSPLRPFLWGIHTELVKMASG
jgi:hypothetical protein